MNPLNSTPLVLSALLDSIAEVETGGDDTVVGPDGERSRYQITHTVWNDVFHRRGEHAPSFSSCHGATALAVAWHHLEWLDANIPHDSLTERYMRAYVLAWAWHGGLSSWTHYEKDLHIRRVALNNYATRVLNLYEEKTRDASSINAPDRPQQIPPH